MYWVRYNEWNVKVYIAKETPDCTIQAAHLLHWPKVYQTATIHYFKIYTKVIYVYLQQSVFKKRFNLQFAIFELFCSSRQQCTSEANKRKLKLTILNECHACLSKKYLHVCAVLMYDRKNDCHKYGFHCEC